jgi:hypothetical protein
MASKNKKMGILPRQKSVSRMSATKKEIPKEIPVVRNVPDELSPIYSDGMMIQHKDGMFIYSFLQTRYPLVLTDDEALKVNEIEQRCVSQIIVSPQQAARNLNVWNKNFRKFLELQSPETKKHLEEILDGSEQIESELGIVLEEKETANESR